MVYKQDFRNLEYMEDENPVFCPENPDCIEKNTGIQLDSAIE